MQYKEKVMAKIDLMTDDEFIQLIERAGLENIKIGGAEFKRKKDDYGYYYTAKIVMFGVIIFDDKYVLVDSSNFIRTVTDTLETGSLEKSIEVVEIIMGNGRASKESTLAELGFTHYECS